MYVERNIATTFVRAVKTNNIVVVVGPRQSGKTTFLKEHSTTAGASYVFFDDPDVKELFDKDIKSFENQYVSKDKVTILDEVQYGKDPGRKLKYLADEGRRLWVTSSSQVALSKEVLSWLVGRAAILKLYPFSLDEFLAAKGQKELTDRILVRAIDAHIEYGGYPKVVLEEDDSNKEMLLRNLYETMILKDVARTFRIEDIDSLERLAVYLSRSIGNIIVYEKICSELGLSFQSVKKYISSMEKSYLIILVAPFYRNKLKEVTKQRKLYFIDTGLRNATANEFGAASESAGKLFENYVVIELVKAGYEVRYWQSKGNAEVDIIIQKGNRIIPIEVKLRKDNNVVERSMRAFIEAYAPKQGFVIFKEGTEKTVTVSMCKIKFTNITKLLSALKVM